MSSLPTVEFSDFPIACRSLVTTAIQTLDQRCVTNCLPIGRNDHPLEIFTVPWEATNCGELEEDLCRYTSCCLRARGRLNALYRCILTNLNSTGLDVEELDVETLIMADKCPLSCQPSNYDLDASNFTSFRDLN